MTITRDQLLDQLDTARTEADRWESAAHALEEQLASTAYVLAQVCHHHSLITGTLPDDGRAAVAQLIADLGEDELVNLLITLPTGWADADEITAADPEPLQIRNGLKPGDPELDEMLNIREIEPPVL